MEELQSDLIPNKEKLLKLMPQLVEKDYSSTVLTFIPNAVRTLNYWGTQPNILPLGDDGKKRRRYSFFDMIWLMLIKELRGYGMEKQALFNLKEELITPIDVAALSQSIHDEKEQLREMLKNVYKLNEKGIAEFFEMWETKRLKSDQQEFSRLFTYVGASITRENVVRLLITKKGHHHLYVEKIVLGLYNMEKDLDLEDSYICVNLTNLINTLLSLPVFTDTFKENLLTAHEQKVFKFLREGGIKSITITFRDKEMNTLELTRERKIKSEARLHEIMLKNDYEKIEIINVKGKVIYCESIQSIKL